MAITRMTRAAMNILAVVSFFHPSEVHCSPSAAATHESPSSNLDFYMHNPGFFTSFPNSPVLAMKKRSGGRRGGSFKSSIITFDNMLTEATHENSSVLGRAQGIRVVDEVGQGPLAVSWFFTTTFFNTSLYDGTLSFQGTTHNFPSPESSEITVTGGTGVFRFARGFATFKNFYKAEEISTLEGQHFQVFLRY